MSKVYGIIYKVTNKVNGKCYIGQTTKTLKHRKNGHIYVSKKHIRNGYFQNSIRKYGEDNFKWEILCECESRELLNIRETMKIIVEHSHVSENGYNLTWGGDGCSGLKQTDEIIKKKVNSIRERGGYIWDDERRKKLSDICKGKKQTDKTIEKRVNSIRERGGYIWDDERRKKMSDSRKGKKHSSEQVQKNRESHLGKIHSVETKQKMSKSHKGYIRTKEHQDKLNESQRGSRKYLIKNILKAFKMKQEGLSQHEIAKIMNVSRTTIQYWFRNGEEYYHVYTT